MPAVGHYQAFPDAQAFSNTLPSFTLQSEDLEACYTSGFTGKKYLSTFQVKKLQE